jgi:sulfur-carrier protein
MKVTVKMGAPLSQVIGEKKVILSMPDGATLADVLSELGARYPDFEEGLKGKGLRKPFDRILYSLFVNARPVALEQAGETALVDGDRISLFLPVAGG